MVNKDIEYRPIKGIDGYFVSNNGDVFSNKKWRNENDFRQLKAQVKKHGYKIISLYLRGIGLHTFLLHRLVAEAFIPNPENKPEVDHINGDRTDNRVENLRWCTREENLNNPTTLKRYSEAHKGEKNYYYGKHMSDEVKSKISKANDHKKRPILQIDAKTNEVVNTYSSRAELIRMTGFNKGDIYRCCNGKQKTCHGFIFAYAS